MCPGIVTRWGGLTMNQAGDGLVSAGQNKKLTSSQLRVLGFIAACGVQGCSETKRTIAEKLCLSMKTVDRAIHRLREDALIVSEARFGENGTQLGNAYYVSAMKQADLRPWSFDYQEESGQKSCLGAC